MNETIINEYTKIVNGTMNKYRYVMFITPVGQTYEVTFFLYCKNGAIEECLRRTYWNNKHNTMNDARKSMLAEARAWLFS